MSQSANIRKILITGGAGYIGNSLITSLPKNVEIIVIDNFLIDTEYKRTANLRLQKDHHLTIVPANVSEVSQYQAYLKDIDVVVYMASLNSFTESNRNPLLYLRENNLNLQIFLNALTSCSSPVKKFILTSSRGAHGEGPHLCLDCQTRIYPSTGEQLYCPICTGINLIPQKITETDLPHPSSYYGLTKRIQEQLLEQLLEQYCQQKNISLDIFRIFNVFGENQGKYYSHIGIIPQMYQLITKQHQLNLNGNGTINRDFIHISDVVTVLLKSIYDHNPRQNHLEVYNLGSGQSTSLNDLASYFQNLGYKFKTQLVSQFGDVHSSTADTSKTTRVFGLHPSIDLQSFIAREYSKLLP